MRAMIYEQDHQTESAKQLREEARKLLELMSAAADREEKRGLAKRAFVLVQRAEEFRRLD
jgi:hypothetical protein